MKPPNEREDFLELLRLAYVAGTEAAESIVDHTELINHKSLQSLRKGNYYLIIPTNGIIHTLFQKYSSNNHIDNANLFTHNNQTILNINYNFSQRKKELITLAALNAIKHVLSSLEKIIISTLE